MNYNSTRWKNKRKRILKRDSYLCQECKRYGKTTQADTVHHIVPVKIKPELGFDNDNLISLCNSCHEKMHNKFDDSLTELGLKLALRNKNKN